MTALGDHAIAELDHQGIVDPERAQYIAIVGNFADFSDEDRPAAIALVNVLLQFKALSPLTNDPDEWTDRSDISGGRPLWQSERDPDAWSHDGGETYYYQSEQSGEHTAAEPPP